jgi:hypothetical protein
MSYNTAHAAKRITGLYRGFSCDLPHFTAANTRPTQAAIIPPVQRWSVSQRRSTSSAYQIPDATPGRWTAQHSRPIIIMYIRVQRCAPVMDPCQTVQHIADHASPAAFNLVLGQSGTLHPAGQSSSRSAAGGAEPLTATAAALFGLSPDSQ